MVAVVLFRGMRVIAITMLAKRGEQLVAAAGVLGCARAGLRSTRFA
jgi:hypothetical protein